MQLLNGLAADVLAVCKSRNWSLHWTARGAYLHLESSEFVEALRGKRGEPKSEAADVLIVLMSMTESAGIPFGEVVEQARATVEKLRTKPRYSGEEFEKPAAPPAEQGPTDEALPMVEGVPVVVIACPDSNDWIIRDDSRERSMHLTEGGYWQTRRGDPPAKFESQAAAIAFIRETAEHGGANQ